MEDGVGIVGCGAVSAAGEGVKALNAAVAANASALSRRDCRLGRVTLPIVAGFLARENPDPFALAARAIEEALAAAPPLPGRVGLVLATTKGHIAALESMLAHPAGADAAGRRLHPATLAADLARVYSCSGPVQCVSSACISGLLALQQGAAFLRRGAADAVIVAGVDVVSNFVLTGFNSLKSLDPEGCRPFDKDRFGLSLGEGAGAVVLMREGSIRLAGCGVSNDANHLTGPSRDGSGLALAIKRAVQKAGVTVGQIDYIHAHGTGTPYNDAMESLAFRAVFGERVPPFSASKGILGHTLGAAGILETILCVEALRARQLPGTPRLRERDPVTPDSLVPEPRPAPHLQRILKVNCGFGGTNAAVILEREAA